MRIFRCLSPARRQRAPPLSGWIETTGLKSSTTKIFGQRCIVLLVTTAPNLQRYFGLMTCKIRQSLRRDRFFKQTQTLLNLECR